MCRKNLLKTVLLIFLCGVVLWIVQGLLDRNWIYPSFSEAPDDMMEEFYQLTETEDFQVVFFGSSGFEWDIDPMQIYKDTGIVTYNMASSGQPAAAGYFLCQEMFKTQNPDVVVVDATKLFDDSFFDGGYHYILDHMPLSMNKVNFAKYYAAQYASEHPSQKETDALIGALVPFYQYHERWADLSETDFEIRDKVNLYRKGYYPCSGVTKSGMNIDWMNSVVEQSDATGYRKDIADGTVNYTEINEQLYNIQLDEEIWRLIVDMKRICEENHTQMLLIKTPAYGHPIVESAPWTLRQSQIVKERAEQESIDFLDLQYDVDLGLDWEHDAGAGTQHLNHLGTQKLTKYIEKVLLDKYGLSGKFSAAYEEDIPIYDKICRLMDLQLEDDLYQWLNRVSELEDVTLFFSASDDMALGLSPEICRTLNEFGLQADFSSFNYSDAYLAIVENRQILQESSANRSITSEGILENGQKYSVSSSGFIAESKSSILIDDTEYSLNKRGLNIVVLDNESGLVLDSVGFDLHDAANASVAMRNYTNSNLYLHQYEDYLMKLDAERGIE